MAAPMTQCARIRHFHRVPRHFSARGRVLPGFRYQPCIDKAGPSVRDEQLPEKCRFKADIEARKTLKERQQKPRFDGSATSFQASYGGLHR
jgi:hypothetical protein